MNGKINKTSIISIVIVLCLTFGLSYAWFANNRDLNSEMDNMEIKANGLKIQSYNVYHYDYEENQIKNIYNDDDYYSLAPYDSIFDERNSNTLLIFEVLLYNFSKDDTKVNLHIDRKPSKFEFNDMNNHYTSNLIYAKAATAGTLGINNPAITDTEKFDIARDEFADIQQKEQFITVSRDDNTKKYSLLTSRDRMTLSVTLTESERAIINQEDGQNAIIPVYFVFDYSSELIKAQGLEHFSEISIIENTAVDYKNDIESILFEN